jgi:hypothetical protein
MRYTRAELSRILKVSRAAITQAANRKSLILDDDGLIDPEKNAAYLKGRIITKQIQEKKQALKEARKKKQEAASTPSPPFVDDGGIDIPIERPPDYNAARAELTEIKAKIAQLEYEKAQGLSTPI